jgi:hypothetical protein
MADLHKLQVFAESHGFDLTSPLKHSQVEALANEWLPRLFFFEAEKFHPISLDEMISMVKQRFSQLSENKKEDRRLHFPVQGAGFRSFDPPVVFERGIPFFHVLSHGTSAEEGLGRLDADTDTIITHGANFDSSDEFFGGQTTVLGGDVRAGNPFLPRAKDGHGEPHFTVLASYKNLLELLKYELAYELAVEESDEANPEDKYPPDGLRKGFDIADQLFEPSLEFSGRRKVLQDLIAAHEAGEPLAPVLEALPPGIRLNRSAWNAITRYAFLEYDFFYAYNDYGRIENFPANVHEGDIEGCCLVFDRRQINQAAGSQSPEALLRVVPHSIITSVHNEDDLNDKYKRIPTPIPPPDNTTKMPSEILNLAVYIAWASHATYLTSGVHEVISFDDAFRYVEENSPIPFIVSNALLPLIVLFSIWEHFNDVVDKTSEDGLYSGPKAREEDPLWIRTDLTVMPMSKRDHIYMPVHRELLRLRAFAGKWGGHDGFIDKSPEFKAKTGRYFRKLLRNL